MEQGQDIMGQMDDELSTVFCMIQFGTVFQLVLHPIITIYTIDLYGPVWSVGVVWSVGAVWSVEVVWSVAAVWRMAAVWSVGIVLVFLEWDKR